MNQEKTQSKCPVCQGAGTIEKHVLKKRVKFSDGEIPVLYNLLLAELEHEGIISESILIHLIAKLFRRKNPLFDKI